MNKLTIKQVIKGLLKLQDTGEGATLLGIGPMSTNVIQASFELAKENDFPLMFIASRNQVDEDELGGGYVNGWNQLQFHEDIKAIAASVGFKGWYYICRDHGGPWQRDNERNAHLPIEEAMKLAKQSYVADIEAGFDLLMIDPTKDPYVIGSVLPLADVIDRTIELIAYCEEQRILRNLPEIGYEVGTEETNGGLTSTETYRDFILILEKKLKERNLPMPTFIVGQTGTLTRKAKQVGTYNFKNAYELAHMAKAYGVGLKEHNADYFDDVTLLEHIPAKVSASNVAPQYGTQETRAYMNLATAEHLFVKEGLINEPSNLKQVLLDKAIKTERWRKWMDADQMHICKEDIVADEALAFEILDIAGHYVFNDKDVIAQIHKLYTNLANFHIDGQRYVIEYIKRPIREYVQCYNLKGSTTKIYNIMK